MKKNLCVSLLSFVILLITSCSKNADNVPPTPSTQDTSYSNLIEHVTHRKLFTTGMYEESYSLMYDEQNRLVQINWDDTDTPYARFNYTADELSSVVFYDSLGKVRQTYVAGESLFVTPDTLTYAFTVRVNFAPIPDTLYCAHIFRDGRLQKYVSTGRSPDPNRNFVYTALLYDYNSDGNVSEVGCIETNGVYSKRMNPIFFDNKKNPYYEASREAIVFLFIFMEAEVNTGPNNFTRTEYPSGRSHELEYTYNKEGYPLTIKSTSEDFLRYEFRYKPL